MGIICSGWNNGKHFLQTVEKKQACLHICRGCVLMESLENYVNSCMSTANDPLNSVCLWQWKHMLAVVDECKCDPSAVDGFIDALPKGNLYIFFLFSRPCIYYLSTIFLHFPRLHFFIQHPWEYKASSSNTSQLIFSILQSPASGLGL